MLICNYHFNLIVPFQKISALFLEFVPLQSLKRICNANVFKKYDYGKPLIKC